MKRKNLFAPALVAVAALLLPPVSKAVGLPDAPPQEARPDKSGEVAPGPKAGDTGAKPEGKKKPPRPPSKLEQMLKDGNAKSSPYRKF